MSDGFWTVLVASALEDQVIDGFSTAVTLPESLDCKMYVPRGFLWFMIGLSKVIHP